MKVLFAGPSVYGAIPNLSGIALRPPAAHGDVLRAVLDGANVIGLVDGCYESVAAVWHKELLYAMSEGVVVMGGASMGALRAAECASFGMIPVGSIAADYMSGVLEDDAAVAIVQGPVELGSPPLTEALVDVEATLGIMRGAGILSEHMHLYLLERARGLFFKDLTVEALIDGVPEGKKLAADYRRLHARCKQRDALELIEQLKRTENRRVEKPDWALSSPLAWRTAFENVAAGPQFAA